ncbi:MAG: response regulator [Spirochaetales bacterium]|nr:response regulator [Spirochaetales bacterium]
MADILLVEDEEDHARLILRSLSKGPEDANRIRHLKNGREALDYLLETGNFALGLEDLPLFILLDINMPLVNGFEVLETIKKNDRLKSIPVIMLTTTSRREDAMKALSLGANDFMIKPVSFSDFTEKIRQLEYYWGSVSDVKEIFR